MWLNFDGVIMRNKIFWVFILAGFGLFVIYQFATYQGPEIPFEQETWKKEFPSHTGDGKRPGMARNLVNQKLLVGKTRDEVREILGKSEYEDGQDKISYKLEEKYWVIEPVSSEWLDVTFNQENKVEKAEIRFQKIG